MHLPAEFVPGCINNCFRHIFHLYTLGRIKIKLVGRKIGIDEMIRIHEKFNFVFSPTYTRLYYNLVDIAGNYMSIQP